MSLRFLGDDEDDDDEIQNMSKQESETSSTGQELTFCTDPICEENETQPDKEVEPVVWDERIEEELKSPKGTLPSNTLPKLPSSGEIILSPSELLAEIREYEYARRASETKHKLIQKEKFEHLSHELTVGNGSSDASCIFFKKMTEKDWKVSETLRDMGNHMQGKGEMGFIKGGFLAMSSFNTNMSDSSAVFSGFIQKHITNRLSTLHGTISKTYHQCSYECSKMLRELDESRVKVQKLFDTFERCLENLEGKRKLVSDPWLAALQYSEAVSRLITMEQKAGMELEDMIERTEKLQVTRTEVLQSVFRDYLVGKRTQLKKELSEITKTIYSVEKMTTSTPSTLEKTTEVKLQDRLLQIQNLQLQLQQQLQELKLEQAEIEEALGAGLKGFEVLPSLRRSEQITDDLNNSSSNILLDHNHKEEGTLQSSKSPEDSLSTSKDSSETQKGSVSPRSSNTEDSSIESEPTSLEDVINLRGKQILKVLLQYTNSNIIKKGTLYRQNLLSTWKPGYFVLTKFGFLHQFVSSEYLAPEETFFITDWKMEVEAIRMKENNEEATQIKLIDSISERSLFSKLTGAKTIFLRGETQEGSHDWISVLAEKGM